MLEIHLKAWKRKLLVFGALVLILNLALILFLWCDRAQHCLCICARCGARVVVRTQFFCLGASYSAPLGAKAHAEVVTHPSLLTELFSFKGECDHGLSPSYAVAGSGKAKGLITLESAVDSRLGRYGWHSHSTWTEIPLTCFLAPEDRAGDWGSIDRMRFREFLRNKKSRDPGFAESLRRDLQIKDPSRWLGPLLAEFKAADAAVLQPAELKASSSTN